jgi:hypothetical protein
MPDGNGGLTVGKARPLAEVTTHARSLHNMFLESLRDNRASQSTDETCRYIEQTAEHLLAWPGCPPPGSILDALWSVYRVGESAGMQRSRWSSSSS